jgi:hypothetical protein
MADETPKTEYEKYRSLVGGAGIRPPDYPYPEPVQQAATSRNQEVTIQHVENGFVITIGCKTFVAERWSTVANGLDDYWVDPVGAERKFCKK